jgi:hypothetical protein
VPFALKALDIQQTNFRLANEARAAGDGLKADQYLSNAQNAMNDYMTAMQQAPPASSAVSVSVQINP